MAGVGANKFSFSWDEQPVCRKCTGTTSLTGSPTSSTDARPKRTATASSARSASSRCAGRLPLTNKLLLEAGIGTTYYQWGGRELDPNPTET